MFSCDIWSLKQLLSFQTGLGFCKKNHTLDKQQHPLGFLATPFGFLEATMTSLWILLLCTRTHCQGQTDSLVGETHNRPHECPLW